MFLKFDMQHGASVTRQGHKNHSNMRHDHFLNLTGDKGINKRQRHATLAFLKIATRHGDPLSPPPPPSRAPFFALGLVNVHAYAETDRRRRLIVLRCLFLLLNQYSLSPKPLRNTIQNIFRNTTEYPEVPVCQTVDQYIRLMDSGIIIGSHELYI